MLFGLIRTRAEARADEERQRKHEELTSMSRQIRALALELTERVADADHCPLTGQVCPFSRLMPPDGPRKH